MMTRLFLYGTLMSGERSHGRLRGSPCLGPARTIAAYTLFHLGAYPAMAGGGETAIQGELYEVDAALLAELDAFEGVPDLYERVAVRLEDGEAQGYAMRREQLAGRPVIAGGAWRTR
jgi:gamma-glutamylcyclotransferase (GGCT)/AIG2-like uncharacterized protein YtfP